MTNKNHCNLATDGEKGHLPIPAVEPDSYDYVPAWANAKRAFRCVRCGAPCDAPHNDSPQMSIRVQVLRMLRAYRLVRAA